MKKQLILTSLIAVNALLLAGCVAPQESGPAPTTQISCRIPKIERLPETQEAQEKGGLEIAITPALYKSVRVNKTTTRQAEATLGVQLSFVGQDVKNKVYVEQVTTPSLKPQPGRLEFEIRINNKLDRVFRAQGAVVQFNVAGKMIPFGNMDYKEFINGIVPPRNEAEFKIMGPSFDAIPDHGTIGVFLYDVVTATDVAGNITAKQNYEWYFNYTMQPISETAEIKTEHGLMDIFSFQQLMRRQQQQQDLQN